MNIENIEFNTLPIEDHTNQDYLPSESASFEKDNPTTEDMGNIDLSESTKQDKKSKHSKKKIRENVEENTLNPAPILSHYNTNSSHSAKNSFDDSHPNPDLLIRDLELSCRIKFSDKQKKLIKETARLNLYEGRGITKADLESFFKNKNSAEELFQQAVELGLLVPLTREDKMGQYALVNCIPWITIKTLRYTMKSNLPDDKSLGMAHELSKKEYGYSNILLQTKLNFLGDYDNIEWNTLGKKNRQKRVTIGLNHSRNCTFTISRNGTVFIFIGCTLQPFEFHNDSGQRQFFSSFSKIKGWLKRKTNRSNVVPSIENWFVSKFDYSKDLPVGVFTKNIADSTFWSPHGSSDIGYLRNSFRIYRKKIPFSGEIFRFEGNYTTKKKINVKDMISNISKSKETGKYPFMPLEEMLRGPFSEK